MVLLIPFRVLNECIYKYKCVLITFNLFMTINNCNICLFLLILISKYSYSFSQILKMNADMSQGLEKVSVSWVNRFDGKPLPSFKYISTCVLHEDLQDHQFEVFEEDRCCSSSFNRGSLIDGTQKDDLRECRVGCKNGPLSNGIKHKFQVRLTMNLY